MTGAKFAGVRPPTDGSPQIAIGMPLTMSSGLPTDDT